MDTIVIRERGNHPETYLNVTATVLKTIEELSKNHENHMFQIAAVAKAISQQGWNIAPHQVEIAINYLIKKKGYYISATGTGGWYIYDASKHIGYTMAILAVSIACPECGGVCDTSSGSSMIAFEERDQELVCEECGAKCYAPHDAFNPRKS